MDRSGIGGSYRRGARARFGEPTNYWKADGAISTLIVGLVHLAKMRRPVE
ncbi:hypothetical protein ACIP79_19235 [Streptomyces sp. NPDC088747]